MLFLDIAGCNFIGYIVVLSYGLESGGRVYVTA